MLPDSPRSTRAVPRVTQTRLCSQVKLAGNSLIIKGEKRQDHKEERDGYHLSERSYGSFQRSFALPEGVDRDKIDATFGKGVLRLSLPKQPGTADNTKKISIKAE